MEERPHFSTYLDQTGVGRMHQDKPIYDVTVMELRDTIQDMERNAMVNED